MRRTTSSLASADSGVLLDLVWDDLGVPLSAERRALRRRVVRVVVVAQIVVALLTGGTVALAYQRLNQGISAGDSIDHEVGKQHLIGGDPLNILVMGSDSRAGAGNDIDGQTDIGQRSDTTILLHISADRKDIYGVSLPRDALVTRPVCTAADGSSIPGGTLQMFNAAYSLGGARCAVAQVESLTGLFIDHYVVVDFEGFKTMVDAIHGVQVCIPEPIDDQAHGIVLKAGTQTLDGNGALKYVRERYSTANSDVGRMKRQQAFIASMLNKVISAGTLTHPSRVYNFARAATGSITTDPDLASLGDLVGLARQIRRTNLDDISFITVPFEEYEPDPNRLVWAPQAQALWKRMEADKPLSAKYDGQVITAQDPIGGSASPSAAPSGSASGSATGSASPSVSPSASASAQAAQNGLCA